MDMIDTFRLGGYWGSRPETLNEIISKTLNMFKQLSEEDEQFTNWYEGASSRKKALEKKVNIDSETINRLFREGIKKGELDEAGYSVHRLGMGLWSGHSDQESNSISIYAGGKFETESIKNCCILSLPSQGIVKDSLLKLDKVKNIMSIFIQNWNPDCIILGSKRLSNTLNTINEIGWVTYKKELKYMPKLNANLIYEKFHEGHIFYLNTTQIPNYDLMDELQILKVLDQKSNAQSGR